MATVLSTSTAAAAGQGTGRKLDEALERAASKFGDIGAQAVVIRNGRVMWSGNRGKATIDPATPVTDRTLFSYASLGKMLFATFVLHQAENGVLDLDKPISTYIGDEVAGSRVVTTRMLLTHTAGYPDLYGDPATAPLFPPGDRYDPNRPYTFEMLNAGIRQPVDPGRRFEYSNTGYIILGHVLAKISGGDRALECAYRDFVRRAGTAWVPVTDDVLTIKRTQGAFSRFAHGYDRLDDGNLADTFTRYGAKGIPTDLYGLPFTDGALAGTATGPGLVLDALFVRGTMLRPDTVRMMVTPSPQSRQNPDPESGTYGMGTFQTKAAGHTWQGHAGSYGGFMSMAATDVDRGITIAVVVNETSSANPATVIWQALAEAATPGAGAAATGGGGRE
ncbi:serine hydrolase domain-containing protein [Kutzneria chonburiensis]|uniref:Serine hydrolase domain-containing protein n=1 Tax=Kutzneria chonburiensis TaxID=1483604 RepID=A0ABV6MJW6_9PSEU|nr:serine hydrolase domain-containing protein [Kutzneria chonburiensis]